MHFGNKSELCAINIGKFKGITVPRSGKNTPILIHDIKFLSKAIKLFELSGKDDQLKVKFKILEYSFDHKIKSGSGFLFGLKVITRKGDTSVPQEKGHMFLTHANKVTTKATMKKLNYSLGAVPNKPRKYCAIAKSKQKNVCKMSPRLDLQKFIDISNLRWATLGCKKF